MKILLSLSLLCCLVLGACSSDDKPSTVLTNSQEKALKDAKAIDDTLIEANKERAKQLEEEE